jgi:hypothetical protein
MRYGAGADDAPHYKRRWLSLQQEANDLLRDPVAFCGLPTRAAVKMEDFHRPSFSDSCQMLSPTREVLPSQVNVYGSHDPRPRSMKRNCNWSMIVVGRAKAVQAGRLIFRSGDPRHYGIVLPNRL